VSLLGSKLQALLAAGGDAEDPERNVLSDPTCAALLWAGEAVGLLWKLHALAGLSDLCERGEGTGDMKTNQPIK
jgi:hypothetical protein